MRSSRNPIIGLLTNAVTTAACAAFPEHDIDISDRPRNRVGIFEGSRIDNTFKNIFGILVVLFAILLLWKSLQKASAEQEPIHFQLRA